MAKNSKNKLFRNKKLINDKNESVVTKNQNGIIKKGNLGSVNEMIIKGDVEENLNKEGVQNKLKGGKNPSKTKDNLSKEEGVQNKLKERKNPSNWDYLK